MTWPGWWAGQGGVLGGGQGGDLARVVGIGGQGGGCGARLDLGGSNSLY